MFVEPRREFGGLELLEPVLGVREIGGSAFAQAGELVIDGKVLEGGIERIAGPRRAPVVAGTHKPEIHHLLCVGDLRPGKPRRKFTGVSGIGLAGVAISPNVRCAGALGMWGA